jgi:pyruvate/2-oxoglutarate dehydrogenase complex dihydrolipoamide dehydrogenase (E3) component
MPEQADVVVIGMGPGGEDIAGRLAESGFDVAGSRRASWVVSARTGGVCPAR